MLFRCRFRIPIQVNILCEYTRVVYTNVYMGMGTLFAYAVLIIIQPLSAVWTYYKFFRSLIGRVPLLLLLLWLRVWKMKWS